MVTLPESNSSLLVRTDFCNELQWQALVPAAATESEHGFRAHLEIVDDSEFINASWHDVNEAFTASLKCAVVLFIADSVALGSDDFPILVLDGFGRHEPFRCVVSELWGVDNNLNIANMDWEDFTRALDENHVFRGF